MGTNNSGPSRLRVVAETALLVVAYVATARVGLSFHSLEGNVTAVWPPAGLALAVLLLRGRRLWPGVAIGALIVNLTTGSVPVASAIGMAAGNTLEAVIGATLFRRYFRAPALGYVRDVGALIGLAAVVSTLVAATIGVASLVGGGAIDVSVVPRTWLVWWVGDALGVLVVAPAILVWATPPDPAEPRRLWELIGGCALLAGAACLVFGVTGRPHLLFPLLVLLAVRGGLRGAATANLVVGAIAVLFTAQGLGPFARSDALTGLWFLDLFLAAAAITSLVLAALVAERDRAHGLLKGAAEALAIRVVEGSQALEGERLQRAEAQKVGRLGSWDWEVGPDRVTWSDELYRIFGIDAADFEPTFEGYLAHVHPDDLTLVLETVAESRERLDGFQMDHRIVAPDGAVRWIRSRGHVVADAAGNALRITGTAQDVTDEKRAEAALRESERRYRTMVETSQEGIWLLDRTDVVTFANQRMAELLGHEVSDLIGRPVFEFLDEDGARVARAQLERRRAGHVGRYENRLLARDGTEVWVLISGAPLWGPEGEYAGSLAMIADITERKALEDRLVHQATHDALTGLPNRALFNDRLAHALARRQRHSGDVAVLLIDLDDFKKINDAFGHGTGDTVLTAVAERLASAVRTEDTLARLGGDEFVVVCEDVVDPAAVVAVADRLLASLAAAPIPVGDGTMRVTASIGIAVAQPDDDASTLMRHVDVAMYTAKGHGRDRAEIFQPAAGTSAQGRPIAVSSTSTATGAAIAPVD
jgi:diguanylate cyclase (GGDEF)-like protein/PAS domain S-box-containing protein